MYEPLYKKLATAVNLVSDEYIKKKTREGVLNIIKIEFRNSEIENILLSLTELLYELQYQERIFDVYNDEDCESDQYLWLQDDIGYCRGCKKDFEDRLLNKI